MKKTKTYLSLGSNLGNREKNIIDSIRGMEGFLEKMEISGIYETEPMYVISQPRFLNAVVRGDTVHSCFELLRKIRSVEDSMGRNREGQTDKGPRIIDIDILLFGGLVLDTSDLAIPHKEITERQFVLIPLLDLDPGLVNPRTGISFRESLANLGDQGVYTYDMRKYNLKSNNACSSSENK